MSVTSVPFGYCRYVGYVGYCRYIDNDVGYTCNAGYVPYDVVKSKIRHPYGKLPGLFSSRQGGRDSTHRKNGDIGPIWSGSVHNGVCGKFGRVRFLVACFQYKTNPKPRKNICCGENVAQMPLST